MNPRSIAASLALVVWMAGSVRGVPLALQIVEPRAVPGCSASGADFEDTKLTVDGLVAIQGASHLPGWPRRTRTDGDSDYTLRLFVDVVRPTTATGQGGVVVRRVPARVAIAREDGTLVARSTSTGAEDSRRCILQRGSHTEEVPFVALVAPCDDKGDPIDFGTYDLRLSVALLGKDVIEHILVVRDEARKVLAETAAELPQVQFGRRKRTTSDPRFESVVTKLTSEPKTRRPGPESYIEKYREDDRPPEFLSRAWVRVSQDPIASTCFARGYYNGLMNVFFKLSKRSTIETTVHTADGILVAEVDPQPVPARGIGYIRWNGLPTTGYAIRPGSYVMTFVAVDEQGRRSQPAQVQIDFNDDVRPSTGLRRVGAAGVVAGPTPKTRP